MIYMYHPFQEHISISLNEITTALNFHTDTNYIYIMHVYDILRIYPVRRIEYFTLIDQLQQTNYALQASLLRKLYVW